MSESKEKKKVLDKIIAGKKLFSSNGYVSLKKTVDGKSEYFDIPIKSFSAEKMNDRYGLPDPNPPVKREFIKRNSPEGKVAGLAKDTFCNVFDFTDEEFQKRKEESNEALIWYRVADCLNVEWIDEKTNNPVTSVHEKVKILKDTGITLDHIMQIWVGVKRLSVDLEEEEDFLSVKQ